MDKLKTTEDIGTINKIVCSAVNNVPDTQELQVIVIFGMLRGTCTRPEESQCLHFQNRSAKYMRYKKV